MAGEELKEQYNYHRRKLVEAVSFLSRKTHGTRRGRVLCPTNTTKFGYGKPNSSQSPTMTGAPLQIHVFRILYSFRRGHQSSSLISQQETRYRFILVPSTYFKNQATRPGFCREITSMLPLPFTPRVSCFTVLYTSSAPSTPHHFRTPTLNRRSNVVSSTTKPNLLPLIRTTRQQTFHQPVTTVRKKNRVQMNVRYDC